MEDKAQGERCETKEKIVQIFSDFMTRVTIFEELVAVGSKLLVGFQQALGFIGRPPIDMTSELVKNIIKAHECKRLSSYVQDGCMNTDDRVQNTSKLHTCHLGLQDHINKARDVVGELESLLDDATVAIQTANENLPSLQDEDINHNLDSYLDAYRQEDLPSSDTLKPEDTDYAAMMAILYCMVKQDYLMQFLVAGTDRLLS